MEKGGGRFGSSREPVEAAWRRGSQRCEKRPANATLKVERKREPSSMTGGKETPRRTGGWVNRWSGKRDLNLLRRLMLTGRRDTRIPTTALSHSRFQRPPTPHPSAAVRARRLIPVEAAWRRSRRSAFSVKACPLSSATLSLAVAHSGFQREAAEHGPVTVHGCARTAAVRTSPAIEQLAEGERPARRPPINCDAPT